MIGDRMESLAASIFTWLSAIVEVISVFSSIVVGLTVNRRTVDATRRLLGRCFYISLGAMLCAIFFPLFWEVLGALVHGVAVPPDVSWFLAAVVGLFLFQFVFSRRVR